jgi:hypothetical protein
MSRRAGDPARPGEAGSVFIETVVALAILAGILTAVWQVTASSALRHRAVESRRYALMVARSALSSVGSAQALSVGSSGGTDGGDAWRIDTERCGSGDSMAGVLYCVTVSVRDRAGGPPLVTLVSRRLGPAS